MQRLNHGEHGEGRGSVKECFVIGIFSHLVFPRAPRGLTLHLQTEQTTESIA
jgi:hypothetical protein